VDERRMKANFLTGPVELRAAVRAAFREAPLSHRDPAFLAMLKKTRVALCRLVNAPHVALMIGSGTLANDAVAAQLAHAGEGLVLANGEFGERLVDHARRCGLRFGTELREWGAPFDWSRLSRRAVLERPAWIWAVLCETSTGILNPLDELRALAARSGADLCVDAISAIGLSRVDLRGVRFATAVSGKGLAAFPGLAAVFHDGRLATSARIPRYLDLAYHEAMDGVPFTHSSNLLQALQRSLADADWDAKFDFVMAASRTLRVALRAAGLPPLADDAHAAPGIVTLQIPFGLPAAEVAAELERRQVLVAHQSRYLQARNWLQICLMGEIDTDALHRLPAMIAGIVYGVPSSGHAPAATAVAMD
jgi:aspartate aminotransferase-like enzyme